MDLTGQIDKIDASNLTRSFFRSNYLKKGRPLIIKNFSNQFPAGDLWTFEYLRDKIGHHKVGIFDNSVKSDTAYVRPHLYIPFAQFLNIIQKDEPTPYRIFLFNIFKEYPELRKEFPTPDIIRGILGHLGFAFFGGKNTTVRFHYDIDCSSVLMTQLIGRKRIILIPPEYEKLIYKIPFASFSMVDLEHPDYQKYPALKYVKGFDFILNPGEALFMPSRYWHFNTYLEGGMAVSYRAIANTPSDIYNGFMNTTFRILFDKAMNGLLGNRWMKIKKDRAVKKAEKEMRKYEKTVHIVKDLPLDEQHLERFGS